MAAEWVPDASRRSGLLTPAGHAGPPLALVGREEAIATSARPLIRVRGLSALAIWAVPDAHDGVRANLGLSERRLCDDD